jgi:hypothetical protein
MDSRRYSVLPPLDAVASGRPRRAADGRRKSREPAQQNRRAEGGPAV